jgi:ATP-dependent Zn protease
MSLAVPPPPPLADDLPPPIVPVHEPPPDDRERKTRKKMFMFDRVKVVLILGVIFTFSVVLKHSSIPIMSWGDALRDQLDAKAWLVALIGIEVLRQIHYFICEHWSAYYLFWERRVWGGWNRFWERRNPYVRYRLARAFKVIVIFTLIMLVLSSYWGLSFWEATAEAPKRFIFNPFTGGQMPWFFSLIFVLGLGILQFVGIFWFLSRGGIDTYMPEDIKTRFADVWGQDHVLEKVRENIVFLDKPQEIEAKGGFVPSGILLWGPPGTGKTLMAEAVAGETGKPFVFVDPGAFIQMFFGIGVLKVRRLFKKLRKLALRHGGVIVFFDEADTLGNRGGSVAGETKELQRRALETVFAQPCNGAHYLSDGAIRVVQQQTAEQLVAGSMTATRQPRFVDHFIVPGGMGGRGSFDGTLQAILTEMSGLNKPRGFFNRTVRGFLCIPSKPPPKYRILTIMATNMPQSLDAALLRPGRIDRMYHVNYPNLKGRIRTFEGYLNKIRHVLTPAQVESLALMSPRASGAMIKDIVNEALIVAIRHGRDYVTWPDVIGARVFKVHGMPDGLAATSLEQYETAIHEASHAIATYVLRRRDVIDIATIEKRGPVGGFVSWIPRVERDFDWRTDWEIDVLCALASLAGERMFFGGDNSSGVGGDLGNATEIITAMLSRAGMGDRLSSGLGQGLATKDDLDRRVEAKLHEIFDRATVLLSENRWFVQSVANAMLSKRTITGEDVDAIYQGGDGPTVDGEWYHRPSTRALLEDFHSAARVAHETHEVSFDILPPAMPEASVSALPPPAIAARSVSPWAPPLPRKPA